MSTANKISALASLLVFIFILGAWHMFQRDLRVSIADSKTSLSIATSTGSGDTTDKAESFVGLRANDSATNGNYDDSLIRPADEVAAQKVDYAVQRRIDAGTTPMGFRRYRLVEINSFDLQDKIIRSFESYQDDGEIVPVRLQLFDDRELSVGFYKWQEGNFGIRLATGTVVADSKIRSSPVRGRVTITFDNDNSLRAWLETDMNVFRIEISPELPYYLVFESDYTDAPL